MSPKIIVVFGATGQQGGSVVASFLKNKDYIVRAVTRNPDSDKAKALSASGAQVVAADLNDYPSLVKAFQVCSMRCSLSISANRYLGCVGRLWRNRLLDPATDYRNRWSLQRGDPTRQESR